MIRRPPRSTPFPTRRSSDLHLAGQVSQCGEVGFAAPPQVAAQVVLLLHQQDGGDRKSTRLNSSHSQISYAVFCLKKKKYVRQSMSGGIVDVTVGVQKHPVLL